MEPPILSTMVVLYYTNLKFDTNKIMEDLPLDAPVIKVEKRGVARRGESKRDQIKRRVKKDVQNTTGFCHNSITVVLVNNGDGELPDKEITIKIFQNGVFHLTGVLDPRYDMSAMRILLDILWNKCRHAVNDEPERPEIIRRRVVLMNYTTKLSSNDTVAREILHNSIRAMNSELVTSQYDPDVYPGVKIHIGPNNWTAKVFRTGKIILTGITDHEQCAQFIGLLLELFAKVLPTKSKPQTSSVQAVLPLGR
jgi:TATA-box binding protein (TBP) (component of TFIID and TFIIIB)